MQGAPLITANKIFRIEDVEEILEALQNNYNAMQRESEEERARNERFKYEYQEQKLGNFRGYLKYTLEFTEGGRIEFDNYRDVKNMLTTRFRTIVRIYVYYDVSFAIKAAESAESKLVMERISLVISEDEFKIETSLDSQNSRLVEVYNVIEAKVNAVPEKYDRLIKKKELISWKIGMADSLVVLAVILVGLIGFYVVSPEMRAVASGAIWALVVPVVTVGIGLVLGILLGSARTAKIYQTLIPNKKYAGYDTNTHQSVYNDDFVKFKETSDVLIGKKADNLRLRETLTEMERKARRRFRVEMVVIGVLVAVWAAMVLIW